MESLKPVSRILGLLSAILLLVACQTTSTTGYYTDDQRLAEAVKARLAAEPGLTRVGITTRDGVVYLTGVADSTERAARAFQLANQVPGVRQVVNQMQIAAATPPPVTVVTPPVASPPVAVSPPPTSSTIFPGHPPIDVTGIVAAYDPQTRIVTLQDGRMVRIGTGTIVWHAAPSNVIQPGQQIYARNAEPVSVQGLSTVADPGWWRMGIVDRVDAANGLLVLRDGTAVRITSSTPLTMNGQQISLSHIRPGAQVALRMPTTVSGGSAAGGYALPGPTAAPASSSVIFVYPEPILR